MAKTREQKKEILQSYEEYLKSSKAIYIASTNLTAVEANTFKKRLRENDAYYSVIKNTLFRIASESSFGQKIELEGQNAVVFCKEEVVEPAKHLAALKKDQKAEYVLCVLDGNVLDADKIDSLSKLESKEQLLSKLVYLMNYPTTGLARSLANNIQKLCYALNAVKDK